MRSRASALVWMLRTLAVVLFAHLPRCDSSPSRNRPEFRVDYPVDAAPSVDHGSAATPDAGRRRVRWGDCTERPDLPSSRCDVRCNYGDCNANGWTVTYGNGVHGDARCNYGDCNANGWTTRYSDDVTVDVRCNYDSCDENGWSTSSRLGSGSVRCNYSDCTAEGYSLSLPGGGTATVRCHYDDCRTEGFDVSWSGGRLGCRCNYSDCNANGLSCD